MHTLMSRNKEIYGTEGLINSFKVSETWDHVKGIRLEWLDRTDKFYVADRWALLSNEQQEQLNTFRQSLRDITDFDTPDQAADGMPHAQEWFMNG